MFSVSKISILACVISAAYCRSPRSVADDGNFVLLENGTWVDLDLAGPSVGTRAVTSKEVVLYLYTKVTGKDNPCVVTPNSCTNWKNCGFDHTKKSYVITHGWTHSYTSESCQEIKNAFFEAKRDVNIFLADWKALSDNYLSAVGNVKAIGQLLAKVFTFAKDNCGLDPMKLKCVGHSLGAHVCGHMCAAIPGKCGEICGLDPAAPLIANNGPDGRLDETDAHCVDIIHSSSQGLSMTKRMGHRDFYPCGAKNQYGCDPKLPAQEQSGGCDHRMAPLLYALSIKHKNLLKADCESVSPDAAMAKNCSNYGVTAYLGDHDLPCQKGIYYLDTHPLCKSVQA